MRIPIYELVKRCRMSRERMGKILRMTFLAPDIIKAIFDGTYPKTLSLNKITEHEIPLLWSEQRKINPIFLSYSQKYWVSKSYLSDKTSSRDIYLKWCIA